MILRYFVRHAGDPTVHVAVVAVGDNRNSNAESAVRSQELNPKDQNREQNFRERQFGFPTHVWKLSQHARA